MSRIGGTLGALLVTTTMLVGDAATSVAASSTFTCRASALRLQGKGVLSGIIVEPVVVGNGAGQSCSTDSRDLVDLTVPFGVGSVTVARGSVTTVGTGAHPTATAEVANVVISLPGLPVVTASVLTATASAGGCATSSSPPLTGSSQVLGLTVGGSPVTVGTTPFKLSLGPLATLYLNRTVTSNSSLTQRALELDTAIVNLVIAEARVGYTSNPCV